MKYERAYHSMCTIGNNFLVVSGSQVAVSAATVEKYDFLKEKWS